jgi:hypothetical protein
LTPYSGVSVTCAFVAPAVRAAGERVPDVC